MKFHIRHALLPIVLATLLSCIYLFPRASNIAPAALKMTFSQYYDEWELFKQSPSADEIRILAKDTEFSKAICAKPIPFQTDQAGNPAFNAVYVSFVLSGNDLNSSIHRPERCMPAQGHQILSTNDSQLIIDNKKIPLKKLISEQSYPTNAEQTQFKKAQALTYYFFIGQHQLVADHTHRTLVDIKDRILKGQDQRWAYVSFTINFGDVPWLKEAITQDHADVLIREIMTEIIGKQLIWEKIQAT